MIPINKRHQYRYSIQARMDNVHVRSMHDNLKPMFDGITVDWEIQWSDKGKPVYNVEPLINSNGADLSKIAELKSYGVMIYDFDKRNVEKLLSLGVNSEWRPCLLNQSMIDWVGEWDQPRDIDVLHIGNKSERRQPIINTLESMNGIKFVNVTNIYGKEATQLMKRAKVVVNIHRADELQAQEQLRIMWAVACGCTVVSEPSIDPSIPYPIVHDEPLDKIADACKSFSFTWNQPTAERTKQKYIELSKQYYEIVWGFGADQVEVISGMKEILESNKGAINDIQQQKRNQTGSSGLADLFEAIKCDSTSGNSGLTIRSKGHKGSGKNR